jgi:hypothetical protein
MALPTPTGFDSAIVPQIPALFAEFKSNGFNLMWRGGRDGFGADEFHRRCDGHANTLTLIEDTGGNIFGGFTPVPWESNPAWPSNVNGSDVMVIDKIKLVQFVIPPLSNTVASLRR